MGTTTLMRCESDRSLQPPPNGSSTSWRRAKKLLRTEIEFIGRPNRWPKPDLPTQAQLDRLKLLSHQDEIALFRAMNWAKFRADQLRRQLSPESPAKQSVEEIEYLIACATAIRNRLVCIFTGLGWRAARHFCSAEITHDDLLSEANLTLLRAVEKFDCDRGFRFSTYATHAVQRNLYRYVTTRCKQRSQFVASDQLEAITDSRKWTCSYEKKINRATHVLDRMLSRLRPREQFIVRARFGLGDGVGAQTLQSIAELLGVSRERVRQLESRATAALRAMAQHETLDME